MRRIVRALALLSLAAVVTSAVPPHLLTQDALASRPKPTPTTTVRYGDDSMQVVDVWLPSAKGPFPTVLMVHGGCWETHVANRHIMDWAADDLRKRGIAVWNIDYRGVDRPGGGYPGTFLDVSAAADALRVHAAEFNLDAGRIVAVGHSAGGHLALWLAARPGLPASSPLHSTRPLPIASVVSLGGIPDLELASRIENGCGTEVSTKLAAGHFAETSLPHLAPLGVPQMLVNGLEDLIIPRVFATDYEKRISAAGDRVQVDWVPDTGHFELIAPGNRAWDVAVKRIREAFRL
jgi:acetyl esterase/lipase